MTKYIKQPGYSWGKRRSKLPYHNQGPPVAFVKSTPPHHPVNLHVKHVHRAAAVAAKDLGCKVPLTEPGQFGDVTVSTVCPTAIARRRFQARVQKIMRKFQKAHRSGKIRLEG